MMSKPTTADAANTDPQPGQTADAATPAPSVASNSAATTPPPLKPVVQYGANSVELHLVPGGRQILVSGKTKLAKLDRDPALELNDPNVRLILAMAAGPDFVEAVEGTAGHSEAVQRVYAKSQGA